MIRTSDWMKAFLEQARSDWQAYHLVDHSTLPACHAMHYLQMSTEKLAKAQEKLVQISLIFSDHIITGHFFFWTQIYTDFSVFSYKVYQITKTICENL